MKSVGIGIVGIGFMGMTHYLAAQGLTGGRVAAVCSRDPRKLAGDWTGIQGNFGPPGQQMDLSGVSAHADLGDLLADPNVDLVDLCVPNDEHARMAVRALESGKHVLVEKPIALTLADADSMLSAAKASGRLLMVAHVLPFFPEFAFALDAVKSGRYGGLMAVHLNRVISRPDWSGAIGDSDRSGGPAIDLHIHDSHFLCVMCGAPRAVHARGVIDDGAVVHLTTQYLYDADRPAASAISGAICQKGREFAHGFEIYLEKATLSYRFAATSDAPEVDRLAVILPDGSVERPDLGSADPVDAFARELAVAIEAVATGSEPDRLSGRVAREALAVCLAEVRSVREGGVATVA